jgi:hypothetical protein
MKTLVAVDEMGNEIEQDKDHLLTCEQWTRKYGWPSISGLRWMIFQAKNDPELRRTFLRVRRRILLKEREMLAYIELMNERDLKGEVRKK